MFQVLLILCIFSRHLWKSYSWLKNKKLFDCLLACGGVRSQYGSKRKEGRGRMDSGVNKIDPAANFQSQKWKEKLETRKDMGLGRVNNGSNGGRDRGGGWWIT